MGVDPSILGFHPNGILLPEKAHPLLRMVTFVNVVFMNMKRDLGNMIDYTPKKKQQTFAKFSRTTPKAQVLNKLPVVTEPYIRQTTRHPSLVTPGGSASLKQSNVYSGSKLIGIGTLHKSNAIPVFTDEEAKSLSSMRR